MCSSYWCRSSVFFLATHATHASAVLAVVILQSVCLSVHLSDARVLFDKMKQCSADVLIPRGRAVTLVLWHRQWLVGDAPSVWNLHSKWPTPSKNANFARFPLIMSQPYEIAKKVQLWRIGSRPQAFQRAIDGVCTLPLSPPKGGSKAIFFVFLKYNFIWIEYSLSQSFFVWKRPVALL